MSAKVSMKKIFWSEAMKIGVTEGVFLDLFCKNTTLVGILQI
jgi:hypothetical protein